MEVMIRSCPACSAVVMGDEAVCAQCGKPLPTATDSRANVGRTMVSPEELHCPKCHAKVPKGVLRCRDCGAYMDPEVEAAALARQYTRGFSTPGMGGGAFGGGAPFAPGFNPTQVEPGSNFAEVANDDDFDLTGDVNFMDSAMQAMVHDQETPHMTGSVVGGSEDDFEMGSGVAAQDYAVAEEEPPAEAAAPPEAPSAAPEAPATESVPAATAPPVPEVSHSVETGGDVLLDAALAEERDAAVRQKTGGRRVRRSTSSATAAGRFRVFCPNGHRIEVQDRHRGRTGRCPNCRAIFFVPAAASAQTAGETGAGAATAPDLAQPKTGYSRWITDAHLHRVNPAKLKLKPGSLLAEYDTVDLGVSADHLLLATVYAGGGAFRAMQEPKKKPAVRQALVEHFSSGMPLADLAIKHLVLTPEMMQQFRMMQPAVPGEESLFADVPVFGEGRIAIRLPAADAAGERAYLSFSLSQFREFSQVLAESFGLTDFGSGTGIPLEDSLVELTCHYSEAVLRALAPETLAYYRNDPAIKLQILGRRCAKCGLVVSEDSRKKEKIGGKSDASIAKARCPKCKQKFGDITLYGLPATP